MRKERRELNQYIGYELDLVEVKKEGNMIVSAKLVGVSLVLQKK